MGITRDICYIRRRVNGMFFGDLEKKKKRKGLCVPWFTQHVRGHFLCTLRNSGPFLLWIMLTLCPSQHSYSSCVLKSPSVTVQSPLWLSKQCRSYKHHITLSVTECFMFCNIQITSMSVIMATYVLNLTLLKFPDISLSLGDRPYSTRIKQLLTKTTFEEMELD